MIIRKPTWDEMLAKIPAAALASPKAFAAVDVILGATLASTVSRTLSAYQQKIGVALLESLLAAALAIEQDLAVGATSSAAYTVYLSDLDSVTAIVHAMSPSSSALPLATRITIAASDHLLPAGSALLLGLLTAPLPPPRDKAFIDAAFALKAFMAS